MPLRGASAIEEDKTTLKQYLLGQLSEKMEEQVELRLLNDAAYAEEFDVMVDEITDQYVAGGFQGEERDQVEQYFLKSPARRDKLKFAVALQRARDENGSEVDRADQESEITAHKQRSPKRQQRSPYTSYLATAAAVVIALGLGFGVWRAFLYQSDLDKGLAALNSAYREQRPVESRISAFTTYAPFPQTRGTEAGRVDSASRERAQLLLRNAAHDHPGPATYHALGQAYLTERLFDRAIEQFEEALKADPNNATIHSDLGAALLEASQQAKSEDPSGKSFELLSRSLAALNKALQFDPNLQATLYNKALCLEYMLLPEQAREAWQNYLAHDSQTRWAEEARRHLQNISSKSSAVPTAPELLSSFLRRRPSEMKHSTWERRSSTTLL